MAKLLAFPVRLTKTGAFESIEDGEDYYPQELAGLIQTRLGERQLVPEYGIEDPTFSEMDRMAIQTKVDMFGPPVEIDEIKITQVNDRDISLDVEYDIVYPEDFIDEDPETDLGYDEEYADVDVVDATEY